MNCKWAGAVDSLRSRLDDGTLQPGARPSIGRLGRELGLSRKTVAKAFRALEDEMRLERHTGTGYVVIQHGGGWAPLATTDS